MSKERTTLGKAVEASKSNGEIKFTSSGNTEELRKYYEDKKCSDSFNKAILNSLS